MTKQDIERAREVLKKYHEKACDNNWVQDYQALAIAIACIEDVERLSKDEVLITNLEISRLENRSSRFQKEIASLKEELTDEKLQYEGLEKCLVLRGECIAERNKEIASLKAQIVIDRKMESDDFFQHCENAKEIASLKAEVEKPMRCKYSDCHYMLKAEIDRLNAERDRLIQCTYAPKDKPFTNA